MEFWIPRLDESREYASYPQTKNIINRVVEIEFSVKPKNLNRLFYANEIACENLKLPKPNIVPFNKTEYYVNE